MEEERGRDDRLTINSTGITDKDDEPDHRPRPIHRYEKRRPHKSNEYRERGALALGYEPVAQFDVASFIQNSDNGIENMRYKDPALKPYRKYSKDYTDYDGLSNVGGLKVNDGRREGWKDYLNTAETSEEKVKPSIKPLGKAEYSKDFDYNSVNQNELTNDKRIGPNRIDYFSDNLYRNSVLEDSAIHHPEKKGVLKNFKFPFFFHNRTTVMVSPKKDKKRKTFKSSKVGKSKHSLDVNPEDFVADNLYGVDSKYVYNKKKRSYVESLCPVCKKKYMEKLKLVPKTRHVTDKIVHNSRQFYQNLFAGKKINGKKNVDIPTDYVEQVRYRRQRLDEKERRLNEIEDVTKRIEGMGVNTNPTTRSFDIDAANVTMN